MSLTSGLTGSDGGLSRLAKLSPSAIGVLVTVATDPQEWLRARVFVLIAEWFVTKILTFFQYGLGWVIFAYDRVATILLDVAGPLASPFVILADAMVWAIDLVYGAAIGVAHMAGLAGPPAAAFAVALLSAVLAIVVLAVWRVLPVTEAVGGGLEAIR